jgi:hypothetical protein
MAGWAGDCAIWQPLPLPWAQPARLRRGIILQDVSVPGEDAMTLPGAFLKMMQMSRGSYVGNQLAVVALYLDIAQSVYAYAIDFLSGLKFQDTCKLIAAESAFHQELIGQMASRISFPAGSVGHALTLMCGVWHDHIELHHLDGAPLAHDPWSGAPGDVPFDNLVYIDFDGENYMQTNVTFAGRPVHARSFTAKLQNGNLYFDRLGPEAPQHIGISGALERLRTVRLGDSMAPESQMGPLVHGLHRQRVADAVQRLAEKGAQIHASTPLPDLPGSFFPATLITGAAPEQTIEEIFGPVAILHIFKDDAEAVALANQSPYGLGGYVFSQDEERALAVARAARHEWRRSPRLP